MGAIDTAAERLMELLPPGAEREKIIELVRIGAPFKEQQRGRKPGFLSQYLSGLVNDMKQPVTFERVLEELELEAVRRDRDLKSKSPIEKVNRVWEIVTYHHPRKGQQQVTFKTLKNKLTACKRQKDI